MKLVILAAGLTLFVAYPARTHAQGSARSAAVATDSVNAHVRAKSRKKVAAPVVKSKAATEGVTSAVASLRAPARDSTPGTAAARKTPPVPKRAAPVQPVKKSG